MRNLYAIFIALLFCAGTANAVSVLRVDQLNTKIKAAGAHWTAGKTSVSQLPKAQILHRLGVHRPTSPDVEFFNPQAHVSESLPPSIDWRNKDGHDYVSPILDQGNCGSCVAFATIATLETQFNIAAAFPGLDVRFSPQNIFACGGGACDYGWWPDEAAHYLQTTGAPDEACMPYTSGATGQDVACSASCSDTAQRSFRISGYTEPSRSFHDVNAVKQALQNGPLITTLSVYADFMYYTGGVYKHVTGDVLGGHAVSIVGYDDATQSFIIRNSWGTGWGEKGFAHVAYSDVSGIGDETWQLQIPSLTGAVSTVSPRDYSYYTGTVPVQSSSSYSATHALTITAYHESKAVDTMSCDGNCAKNLDVSQWADGRYEVGIDALDSSGKILGSSSRQFFYVVNHKPQLAVSFTGHSGTDLSKPVSGRIEFDVTTSSSSVPMSSIEFHYRGPNGKEVVSTSYVVLNNMTTGWRTNLVPNGDYDVWFVGHVKTNAFDQTAESPHVTLHLQN